MAVVKIALDVDKKTGAVKVVTGELKELEKQTKQTQATVKGFGNQIGRELSGQIDTLAGRAGPLGRILGGIGPAGLVAAGGVGALVAAGAGIVSATTGFVEYASRVDDLSKQLSVSTTTIQAWDKAAQLSGTTLDAVASGVLKMQRNIATSDDVFKDLGLNLAELKRLAPEEQFRVVAEQVMAIKDPVQQTAAAFAVWGGQGEEVLTGLRKGLLATADAAKASVIPPESISKAAEFGDEVKKLEQAWGDLKATIGAFVVESGVLSFINDLTDAIHRLRNAMKNPNPGAGGATVPGVPTGLGFGGRFMAVGAVQTFTEPSTTLPGVGSVAPPAGGTTGGGGGGVTFDPAARKAAEEEAKRRQEFITKFILERLRAEAEILRLDQAITVESEKQLAIEQRMVEADRIMAGVLQEQLAEREALAVASDATEIKVREALITEKASIDAAQSEERIRTQILGTWLKQGSITQQVYDLMISKGQQAARVALGIGDSLKAAFSQLPQTILAAFQGGGDVGKSVGGLFGGAIFGEDSKLVQGLTGKLEGILGKTIGGALGSILPGLGTLAGGALGGLLGKVGGFIGGLFGNKERDQVNKMRDEFFAVGGGLDAMNKKAAETGITFDKLWAAKNVEDYEAALRDVTRAFDAHEQELRDQTEAQAALEEAVKRYGFSIEELGPKFRQQELDKMAGQLLQDYRLLIASGIENATVLERMAPAFNEYVNTALAAGTAIPESMRGAIEQLIQMGKITDENGRAFTSVEDAGISFTETLTEGISRTIAAIDRLVAALTGVKVPPITVPVEFDVRGGIPTGPEPGFATPSFAGGISYVPPGPLPGGGLPAILHPGERVLTARENRSSSTMGRVTVNVYPSAGMNEDALARKVVRLMRDNRGGARTRTQRYIGGRAN